MFRGVYDNTRAGVLYVRGCFYKRLAVKHPARGMSATAYRLAATSGVRVLTYVDGMYGSTSNLRD